MRISSKKILAIALSVAMLASCMVFSFSASAATGLMWENDFDKTGNGWYSQYMQVGEPAANNYAHNNTVGGCASTSIGAVQKNYAVYENNDGNGYMRMQFENTASSNYVSGFRVFHQDATVATDGYGYAGNDSAKASGNFKPTDGSYAVQLDYKLAVKGLNAGASVDLMVAFVGMSWSGDKQWSNISSSFLSYQKAATLSDGNIGDGWKTAVLYFDNLDFSSQAMHIILKRTDGSTVALSKIEVHVDNIKVYKYEQKSNITFMYNGQSVGTATGVDGMTASVPEFDLGDVRAGDFEYYSDSTYENKLTEIKFGATDSTVYIKTASVEGAETISRTWGFENETDNNDLSVCSGQPVQVVNDSAKAHTGSKYALLTATSTSGSTRPQFYIKDADGELVNLKANKDYIVTFYIKCADEQQSGTFSANLWFMAGNGIENRSASGAWAAPNKLEDDFGMTNHVVTKEDGWVKVTRYFNTGAITKNHLLMGITDPNYKSTSGARMVYIDDITVTCVDDIKMYAGNSDRAQYLYQQRIDANNATSLHKYYGDNPAKTDAYTSMYLGATYTSSAEGEGKTIFVDGVEYTLVKRGVEVLNTDGSATAMKFEITADEIENNVAVSGNDYTYAMLLQNMSKAWFESDTQYQYRGYYEIEIPYVETTGDSVATAAMNSGTIKKIVYGNLSSPFSFKSLAGANNFNVANNDSVYWFDDLA